MTTRRRTPRARSQRQTTDIEQARKRRLAGARQMPLVPHACPATAALLLRIARPTT